MARRDCVAELMEQRTNYVEPSIMSIAENGEDAGKFAQGRVRQTISDKRNLNIPGSSPAATKKKSTMNVRTAIIYPKSLVKLIEESVCISTHSSRLQTVDMALWKQNIASLPPSVPTYLTAHSPPSSYPPRMICSVCGYWGRYKCRKCALPYCDINCEGVHAETRCERRVV